MGDREWMYNRWASGGRVTHEWIANTQAFIDEAFINVKGPKGSKTIWCPCRNYGNMRPHTKEDMAAHLYKHGFMRDYTK
jgi:hypothetical protein